MINILEGERWAFSRKHKKMLENEFVRRLHKRMFDDTWRWDSAMMAIIIMAATCSDDGHEVAAPQV